MNQPRAGGRTAIRAVTILQCALLVGCRDVATVWSTQSRSLDGHYLVTASEEQRGGFGTDAIETSVIVKQVGTRGDGLLVFALAEEVPATDMTLRWLTPTHLEIAYQHPATIEFQAITCCGMEISVRHPPADTVTTRSGAR